VALCELLPCGDEVDAPLNGRPPVIGLWLSVGPGLNVALLGVNGGAIMPEVVDVVAKLLARGALTPRRKAREAADDDEAAIARSVWTQDGSAICPNRAAFAGDA
jgi:hypothetical protein